jgi:hypothetical protein
MTERLIASGTKLAGERFEWGRFLMHFKVCCRGKMMICAFGILAVSFVDAESDVLSPSANGGIHSDSERGDVDASISQNRR